MVAYHHFVALSQSQNSEERAQAAHLAAKAYLLHTGPADEQAALYAALIGFLDDPSVRVRAALAYGLLHAPEAPRAVLLALLHDSAIIARAVAQHSPALIEADLVGLARTAAPPVLLAVAARQWMGPRLADTLLLREVRDVTLYLLRRSDIAIPPDRLIALAVSLAADAEVRGALLHRRDLPATARLTLVEAAGAALRGARLVAGAIADKRLDQLLRDAGDLALSAIGEREAARSEPGYAATLVVSERISTRVMLHAVVHGHVLFFADCVAELSELPREKVFSLLESGGRAALNALFTRCGLSETIRNLVVRLVYHARAADLADDVAARHLVVTALTEELITEHGGDIPPDLEDAFCYLSEQNVVLARQAARSVMAAFAEEEPTLPLLESGNALSLPAA